MMNLWQLLCIVKDKFPLPPERIISLYIHFYVMTWSHSRVLEPTRMVGPTLISRISDSDPIGKHFRWTTKYRFVSLGSISRADKRMAPGPRHVAKDVDVIKIFHQHPGLPHIKHFLDDIFFFFQARVYRHCLCKIEPGPYSKDLTSWNTSLIKRPG